MQELSKYPPGVGCYSGVSNNEYHQRWDAVNFSNLKNMSRCPDWYRHQKEHPLSSDALRIGSAVDCLVLEPHRWEADFVIMPSFNKRSKDGRMQAAEFERMQAEQTILTQSEEAECLTIAEAVNNSPVGEVLNTEGGRAQLSCCWQDGDTGLLCKFRPDYVVGNLLIDLKTTGKPVEDFAKSAVNFGYYHQAAWYCQGWQELSEDKALPSFAFLVVEKSEPYYVALYTVPEEIIEACMHENKQRLRQLAECIETGNWPKFDGEARMIEPPKWWLRELGRV